MTPFHTWYDYMAPLPIATTQLTSSDISSNSLQWTDIFHLKSPDCSGLAYVYSTSSNPTSL